MSYQQWLGLAFCGFVIRSTIALDPIVTLGKNQVTYRGTVRGAVEDFLNIKFAHDTSGPLRFAPPKPYSPPLSSEIDATVLGPACPQNRASIPPFFPETPNQSEDCLNLRITRPRGTTADSSEKLPVVVHLVGSGVVKGSAYDETFDPANLVARSAAFDKPIVHVVLNYRLTIFGFARLPILKDQKSLNIGMRDQRAGFQWVKDNIAAFGGDPNRITSFGLSFGGTFTSLHLMVHGGEHGVPFTQAWVMSGPPGSALNMTSDATETHTYAVAKKLGCSHDDDVAILDCLREAPMDKLTETAMAYSVENHPPAGLFTFIPSVDTRKFVKDDGATNAGPALLFEAEKDMKTPVYNFAHAFTEDDYARLFSLYPARGFEEDVHSYEARKAENNPEAPVHYFRIARIMRDLLFTCSSIDFGFEMTKQSRSLDDFPGVYHYVLNQSMITPLFHAAGMPYLGAISESDANVSDTLIMSFLNFAYTGQPHGEGLPLRPESFPELDEPDVSHVELDSSQYLTLRVIGGPLEVTMEIPSGYNVHYREMKSRISQERQRQVEGENLLERCAFINSLAEKLGH
ncbi:alpha/beta-hydrolase [Xylaria arbuscula]|nr:alpha/beta-hydrolase [Xylaria arbuscula]